MESHRKSGAIPFSSLCFFFFGFVFFLSYRTHIYVVVQWCSSIRIAGGHISRTEKDLAASDTCNMGDAVGGVVRIVWLLQKIEGNITKNLSLQSSFKSLSFLSFFLLLPGLQRTVDRDKANIGDPDQMFLWHRHFERNQKNNIEMGCIGYKFCSSNSGHR